MFNQVDSRQDFVKMEDNLLKWWDKNKIVKKYLERNTNADKRFSFIDGPITANNPMGLHHAWGRMYKDLWQRYKNMQGYEQRFQNGFDCQGLWVEVEVEKDLGFNSKKDILNYGIEKFTNKCKARVDKYAKKQTEQSQRLGMFMDWENSYYTMSETNNLYIWRFLKECYTKGLIYKGKSSTTWCPRCETGLSQHEQSEGYTTIDDISVYVKFKVKNSKDHYFLVWTTTPWTLSANVLLAINTKHDYVKTKVDNDYLYLAKESADRLGFTDCEDIPTEDLLKLEFEALYDHIPAQKDVKHFIVDWVLAEPSEGTGIVHIAPGCGAEDFDLGKEVGACIDISPLDETGHFVEGYGELSGKYAHDVADEVIAFLKEKGLLYKTETITHSYPHCWRCKTKCLFRLEDNWFINILKIKPKLKKQAEKAKWIPEFAGKRMQDWLNNMGDWMISRNRFYGLSLPFYECDKCNTLTIVGDKKELKSLAVKPELVDQLPSLHRPWIDDIKIKCPKCGKETSRITDVGDCWLDAGVIPFSTLKYFDDKDYWKKWFPAEFICEMVEQVRLWYYSMLVYGVIFEDKLPYQNVLNHGEVRDENGERFSKSGVNYIPFDDAANKTGSDVIRWVYSTQSVGTNLRFGWKIADEARRKFHLPLWNSYGYFVTYANINKFTPQEVSLKKLHILDEWILSELHTIIKLTIEKLDKYDVATPSRKVEQFIQDLSTWYIRRSRSRFINGDKAAFSTLYTVLLTLTKLLAPIVPFITEEMYQNLKTDADPESIHLCNFPKPDNTYINENLTANMTVVRRICALGQAARVDAGMKVRQPLAELEIKGVTLEENLRDLIKEELNIKKVVQVEKITTAKGWNVQKDNNTMVSLNTNLTDDLKQEGRLREIIRKIQQSRKENGLQMGELVQITVGTSSNNVKKTIDSNKDELKTTVSASTLEIADPEPEPGKSTKKKIFVTIEE